jgi:acyl-CoA synthetase (NDP forming)
MTASGALRPIFEPRSVAVVGVSRSGKQGAIFLLGLLDPGFQGKVYVVNPAASEIMGVRSYPRISALPERPDLAVLVLPAEPAIEVVRARRCSPLASTRLAPPRETLGRARCSMLRAGAPG